MQKTQKSAIKAALTGLYNVITFSKNRTFTIKYSYYYRPFYVDDLAKKVLDALTPEGISVNVLEMGDHFHTFVGGAKSGSTKDSYLWVKLEIVED